MSETARLRFFQPNIGISAQIKVDSDRARTISQTNHCRALLNTSIGQALRPSFMTQKRAVKIIPASKHPHYGYMIPKREEVTVTSVPKKGAKLTEDSLRFPATLYLGGQAIKAPSSLRREYNEYVPNNKPATKTQLRDFCYLADLLCGTLGVLMVPEGERSFWRETPVPKSSAGNLSYLGVSSVLLLHPALVALFLGQLRLAGFLAGTGAGAALRGRISARKLRSALRRGDRKALTTFLRTAKPWILRKEQGLWAFGAKAGDRFDRLLEFLKRGGDAYKLFGNDLKKHWSLAHHDPYGGVNFHGRGFGDYMGHQGKGDKKVQAALAEMRKPLKGKRKPLKGKRKPLKGKRKPRKKQRAA